MSRVAYEWQSLKRLRIRARTPDQGLQMIEGFCDVFRIIRAEFNAIDVFGNRGPRSGVFLIVMILHAFVLIKTFKNHITAFFQRWIPYHEC